MKNFFFILLFLSTFKYGYSQSYSYSYEDPCTKKIRSISIPYGQNKVTVNYYGNLKTFSPDDFNNGLFSSWLSSISISNSNGPCEQVRIEIAKNLNMVLSQNVISTVMNITTITNSLSISDQLGNVMSNSEEDEKKEETQKKSGTENNGTGGNGSKVQTPGSEIPGKKDKDKPQQNKDETNPNTSLGNSLSNAEEGSEESDKKKADSKTKTGSIIGTGDIVMLRSAESQETPNQYRITSSFTRANTKNTRVWGVLVNFTTSVNLMNLTIYKAWIIPKTQWTIIGANSSMLNFERDIFNTTTLVASKRFKGNWKKLTAMGGLNFTAGAIGESSFNNLSGVGGGYFAYKLNKKVSGSILCLAVYSPFTHFYEGKWWESGTLIVPFNSWDYSITKKFKFNLSLSGIYEMKQSILNYQILMGGKILL